MNHLNLILCLVHGKNEDRKYKKEDKGEKKTLSAVSSFLFFFDGVMLHKHSVDLRPSTCKEANEEVIGFKILNL